jgi:3-dehydroquinate synthetase
MGHDKKKAAGRLQFILIRQPGDVFVSDQVPEAAVRQTLDTLRESEE